MAPTLSHNSSSVSSPLLSFPFHFFLSFPSNRLTFELTMDLPGLEICAEPGTCCILPPPLAMCVVNVSVTPDLQSAQSAAACSVTRAMESPRIDLTLSDANRAVLLVVCDSLILF
eukprot:RCo022045